MFDSCQNENVQAMLVPYVERVLAAANRAEVEEHLSQCAECRQRVELIRETLKAMSVLAREGYRPSLGRHPSSGLLFSYALERGLLSKAEIQHIQKHLSGCAACKSEVEALIDIDNGYQERIITVGTNDLVPALKRSRSASSSSSFECDAPVVPCATAKPNFWDYWHQISYRINLPRAAAVGVVAMVLIYALSMTMCSDSEGSSPLEDIADKTADAISTLPSPSVSSISVILSVEEGQTEQLRYLLRSNDIPFEDTDGRIRVPADYASKAQQLWAEAVERSQTVPAESAPVYEIVHDSASPAENGDDYSSVASENVNAEPVLAETQQTPSEAPAVTEAVSEPAYTEPEPSSQSLSAAKAQPAPEPEPVQQRPSESAPKPILRPLHQNVPKVHQVRQAVTSSASSTQVAVPKSSANRPAPKPAIVTPTAAPVASSSDNVEKEVSTNDAPVRPQVVRMGTQPSLGSAETDDSQVVTPTPRSVYEGSGSDGNSAIGSWSNDL